MRYFLLTLIAAWLTVDAQAQVTMRSLQSLGYKLPNAGGGSLVQGMRGNGRIRLGRKQEPYASKSGDTEWMGKAYVDSVIGSVREAPVFDASLLHSGNVSLGNRGILPPGRAFIVEIEDHESAYVRVVSESSSANPDLEATVRVEGFDFSPCADDEPLAPVTLELTGRAAYRPVWGEEETVLVFRPVDVSSAVPGSDQLSYRPWDIGTPGSSFIATFYLFDKKTKLVHLVTLDQMIIKVDNFDLGLESRRHVQKLIRDENSIKDYHNSPRRSR